MLAMRRIVGLILLSTLVAACTAADDAPDGAIASQGPAAEEPTPTPSPEETLEVVATCDGLGRTPRAGQVTFVRDGRLIGVSPDGSKETCLADVSSGDVPAVTDTLSWNPGGDRVIAAGRGIAADLSATGALTGGPNEIAVWSRPTGKSVVFVSDDGRLMKRSSFGGQATDISFLARHDDVTYHPAGTHIATSGLQESGDYGLYLATNVGTEAKLIARGEKARFITKLQFSHDGDLFYTARHGPTNWHLHKLRIGSDARLSTLDKSTGNFNYAVDPFSNPYDDVVWFSPEDCAAGEPDRLHESSVLGGIKLPSHLKAATLTPIGWLPEHHLVVTSRPSGCDADVPQDIYVLSGRARKAVLIAVDVGATAGVRVVLPEPPPPPGDEQAVVA
jgi:hypothetical protein